jgi:hypothetical protein
MKINKKIITESAIAQEVEALEEAAKDVEIENDEELVVDDLASVATDELADKIQTAKEKGTDGEETYSDAKATKIATELKTAAKGFDTAAWAPLDVPNELTDKLDDCLSNSMVGKHMGTHDGTDLLVDGLPGSGKTRIVRAWAKDRGVNLFYLNAKDDDLGANINGFPVAEVRKGKNGEEVHVVTRAFSDALDALDRPNSVLFLDEFNRAAPKLRAVLLTLINEHAVVGRNDDDEDGGDGYKHFKNLLFTVACINPSVPTDPGAMDLNDAEMSRFVDTVDWDSTPDKAIKYIAFYINKLIGQLDPQDDNYNFLYTRYKKIFNLATALLTDPRFNFDSREDLEDLFAGNAFNNIPDITVRAKMLNQRSLTDALMSHGYSKSKFLAWVDKYSRFLDKDKAMIHDILDSWIEPNVTVPVSNTGANAAVSPEAAEDDAEVANQQAAATDEGDFDSIFGTDGDESDSDLFGSTASSAGQSAKVSAADALNRIKGFDFSL